MNTHAAKYTAALRDLNYDMENPSSPWVLLKEAVLENDVDTLESILDQMGARQYGYSNDDIKVIVNLRDATGKTLLGYASSDEVKDVLREVGATNGGSRKRRGTKRRSNKRRSNKRRNNKRRGTKRRGNKRH